MTYINGGLLSGLHLTTLLIDWPYSSFHRYVKQGDYDADWGAGNKIEFDAKVGYE